MLRGVPVTELWGVPDPLPSTTELRGVPVALPITELRGVPEARPVPALALATEDGRPNTVYAAKAAAGFFGGRPIRKPFLLSVTGRSIADALPFTMVRPFDGANFLANSGLHWSA